MANNLTTTTTVSTVPASTVIATDDAGSAHYQVVKLADGTEDATTRIAAGGGVEASALRVTVASDSTGVLSVDDNGSTISVDDGASSLTIDNAALSVTGGGVEASALRVTLASDSTGVVSVDDNGSSLTVDNGGTFAVQAAQSGTWDIGTVTAVTAISNALPAGTNNIGDVDVLSVVPGTGATALGKAIDTAAGATDTGVAALVVRDDALGALTPVEGDFVPLRVDANGALWTRDDVLEAALSGSELQVDIVGALPAGTNAIGKLAANSGVDIGDVDVASIAAGDNNIGNVDIVTTVLPVPAATGTVTSVNDTASSTTLLSSSSSRRGFRVFNDSTSALYVKYGTTASATDFTVKMAAGAYLEENHYYGRVDGIWASDASGAARITELT